MRVRAVSAGRYDASYVPAIPVADLDVSDVSDARQTSAEFVVDTGADLTLLRSAVADEVAIWNNIAGQVHVAGVGDAGEARFVYMALVHVAGQPLLVAADCREDIEENILGRDVLNELDLRLSAKRNVVELEWIEPSPE